MSVPEQTVTRPAIIRHGDVWWEPIESILNRYSVDGASPGRWESTLEDKRMDHSYQDTILSIEENGFVRPLTCIIGQGGQDFKFGDGHHRLAAAIELGLTMVPLEAFDENVNSGKYFAGSIANDSGSWEYGMPIPDNNSDLMMDEDNPWGENDWYDEHECWFDSGEEYCYECGEANPDYEEPEEDATQQSCTCTYCVPENKEDE